MSDFDALSMTCREWQEYFAGIGEKPFRGKQVYAWLHKEKAVAYDDMTNLPKALREKLKTEKPLRTVRSILTQHSSDGFTSKHLMALYDGECIETVTMAYHYGDSVCISSQVGCRMGCRFCASTLSGKRRDLSPGEMLGQVEEAERVHGRRISHIVVMGCGEPLENLEHLLRFVELAGDPDGAGKSLRNITVSTCGLVEQIDRLAEHDLPITLAVSLHAPNDMIRRQLMPVANRYAMEDVLAACRRYTETTHRRITFEYGMIRGMNDSFENANELADRLSGLLCHVNLIPLNPVAEREYRGSAPETVRAFAAQLEKRRIPVTVRREMGQDIDAACGQLRRSYENDNR